MPESKPESKDTLTGLLGLKDQLAEAGKTAADIATGKAPALAALKIPGQVGGAQKTLAGLMGKVKDPGALAGVTAAMGKAADAAAGLKDEAAKKMPTPTAAAKDA